MKLIKQLPDSNDCLACVAAMLCDTTPDHFKVYCKKKHISRFYDNSLLSYIRYYGWIPGIYFGRNFNSTIINIKGIVCYLAVVSDYPEVRKSGSEHAVLWDGKKILDPNPKMKKRALWKYKIKAIIPLSKIA